LAPPSNPPPRHLSSFHLEAIRVGAATREEQAWAEAHSQACERCATLAGDLERFRQEFAAGRLARPPRTAPAAPPRWPARRWAVVAVLGPLAAAAGFALIARSPRKLAAPDQEPTVLEKGGPSLGIVVRRGERIFPARSGAPVRPRDQIRFVLRGVKQRYLLIASVDGSGRANVYVPYSGKESAPVTPADRLEIEGSIVLDEQPGPERIFALLSRTPLTAETVRKSLTAIGAGGPESIRKTDVLTVPAEAQSSLLLEKVAE
jgi:hypothetical protein